MFQVLAELGINVRMIATSPIKVSCVVGRDRVAEAVAALHEAFEAELSRGRRERGGVVARGSPSSVRPAPSGRSCSRCSHERGFPAAEVVAVRVGPLRRHAGARSPAPSSRCAS